MVKSASEPDGRAAYAVPSWITAAWVKSRPFTEISDHQTSDFRKAFIELVLEAEARITPLSTPSAEELNSLATAADNLITALSRIRESHHRWSSGSFAQWIGEAVTKAEIEI